VISSTKATLDILVRQGIIRSIYHQSSAELHLVPIVVGKLTRSRLQASIRSRSAKVRLLSTNQSKRTAGIDQSPQSLWRIAQGDIDFMAVISITIHGELDREGSLPL